MQLPPCVLSASKKISDFAFLLWENFLFWQQNIIKVPPTPPDTPQIAYPKIVEAPALDRFS